MRLWVVSHTGILPGLIGIGLVLSIPFAVSAETVSLAWDPNPEADLAGYKIHIGTSPRTYTQTIDVGHVTTHTVLDLFPGETYFLSVTAYDIFANESSYSAELRASIPKDPEPTTEPAPEVIAATPSPGPELSPVAAAPQPSSATSGAVDGGGGNSSGVLASLLDSVRDVFSSDTSSTALVSPSESSSARAGGTTSAGGTGGAASTEGRLRAARQREVEAERLHQQGRDLYADGKVEDAIPPLRQAADVWAALPLSGEAGVAVHDLGVAYYASERHGEAVQAYQRALAVYRQLEEREFEARVLDDLGRAYEGLGDYARADEHYRSSLEIWQTLGDRAETAAVLEHLGEAQAAAGQYAASLESYRRSLTLFQELLDHNKLNEPEKLEKLKAAIERVKRLMGVSAARAKSAVGAKSAGGAISRSRVEGLE